MCCGYLLELPRHTTYVTMSTHNICFYGEHNICFYGVPTTYVTMSTHNICFYGEHNICFYGETIENYPLIITKQTPYLFH